MLHQSECPICGCPLIKNWLDEEEYNYVCSDPKCNYIDDISNEDE